ncbi:MAG: 1-deoxy-D-xylulose 5-phosphate reductoisomerase [Planctomycetaceae bacterium]|nr:1-deoxy-D-xylulose 5-phosphate reductoisomerase [Planctomycetaceae bacterium]
MTDSAGIHRIAVLGSTGSIGTNCLEVLGGMRNEVSVAGLTAHRRWQDLQRQAEIFQPRRVVISDATLKDQIPRSSFSPKTELVFGAEAIEALAGDAETDVVVAGIVGAAGLRGTWAAIEAGKKVCLANKETLVVAGPLVMDLARERGATLIPVDSEHSAVFQALQSGRRQEVKRVVLTASGGPFRTWDAARLKSVTPKEAMAHPTWNMGPKITIDSATLMNKALEVIEARWLFDLEADQIEVVVHPQSIVHSFVEFVDGSIIAQLSPPDMKLPIQYALTYPERRSGIAPKLDWKTAFHLDFSPPDVDRFPALLLGFEVARKGGTCGAVLNAANEVAVARFLAGELAFCDIPRACRAVLDSHHFDPSPTLSELFRQDTWAREETRQWSS